jgi:hypothetical protein
MKTIQKQFLFDEETLRMLIDLAASQATSQASVVRGLIRDEWARRQDRISEADFRRLMDGAK